MSRPLYRGCNPEKGKDFHAGLWYDRCFDQYDSQWKVPDGGKLQWIGTVAGLVGGDAVGRFTVRQASLVGKLDGESRAFVTDWHFVTGLGNNHPVENGFAWHPTLGVPYLTGAAVKGLLLGWCAEWADGFDAQKLSLWFGDTDHAGQLIFFDAIPTGPVQLKADVMTPHYDKWYAEGATRPNQPDTIPADWHDPVPVPFLVVDKGQSFQFSIARRPGSGVDVSEVMQALDHALQWIGAGAKTSTGYGRMQEDPREVQKRLFQEEECKAAEEAKLQEEAERLAREEAERIRKEEEEQHQRELAAMPEHQRVLAEAVEQVVAVAPRLASDSRTFGELRSAINHVLNAASGWDIEQRIPALDWVVSLLDEHGWHHPDFSTDKRKKWEKKTREKIDALRRA